MNDPRQARRSAAEQAAAAGGGASGQSAEEAHRALHDALGAGGGAPGGEGDLRCLSLCPICRTADVLRATAPRDLQEQWQAWQREVLTATRALIDHYLERLDGERQGAAPVEDIPIE